MPASLSDGNARRIVPRVLLVSALLSLRVVPSLADPVPLGPPVRLGAPQRLTPASPPAADSDTSTPDSTPAASPAAASDAIQVDKLAPIASDWAGPLSEEQGGFPAGLWQGTPRTLVVTALPRLGATTSPGLQALSRRLLLSNATVPADWTMAGDATDLLNLRVDRLIAAGQLEAADDLLALAPSQGDDEGLERHRIELALLANDRDAACHRVIDDVRRFQAVWWSRALIACQALAGDSAKASLGLEMLREQKAPRDDAFDMLVAALAGVKGKQDKLPNPEPLHLALLAANKMPLPAETLAKASPADLRAWAGAEGAPLAQRLAAAERAAAFGAIPMDQLRSLYTKVEFSPEELSNALARAPAESDGRSNALFYLAARAETVGAARAELLRGMLSASRKNGTAVLAARIAEPLVLELHPDSDLGWFAGDAARILLLTGHPAEAQAWLAKADAAAARDVFVVARLALAANGPAWDPDLLDAATAELLKQGDDAAPRRAAAALALLAAFDDPITPAQWATLVTPLPLASLDLPGPAIWFDLPQAAAGKRLGETVLLAVLTATEGDRLTPQPARLAQAIAGLRAVGLDAPARQLAVEAALDAGL